MTDHITSHNITWQITWQITWHGCHMRNHMTSPDMVVTWEITWHHMTCCHMTDHMTHWLHTQLSHALSHDNHNTIYHYTLFSHYLILQYHVLTMDELWVQICDGGGQKSRPGDQSEIEDTKSLNLIYRPVWKTGGACFLTTNSDYHFPLSLYRVCLWQE